ncbi:MAG: hypothetical protein PHS17_19225, partial [Desulfobacterales bacterium]|nr:hypothetical protein [Desulfobacterales bacterium]
KTYRFEKMLFQQQQAQHRAFRMSNYLISQPFNVVAKEPHPNQKPFAVQYRRFFDHFSNHCGGTLGGDSMDGGRVPEATGLL